ncbi:MAG: exodeoxyribonuclease VII small subunit [Solobacterium sp.]|nr:exodeoxyribonuclease VII small subunit [Solobacterium sp.]
MAKKEMKYEESMKRIGEIVDLLQKNELPLDEEIQMFEEGLELIRECEKKLSGYEKQVSEILAKNGGEADA